MLLRLSAACASFGRVGSGRDFMSELSGTVAMGIVALVSFLPAAPDVLMVLVPEMTVFDIFLLAELTEISASIEIVFAVSDVLV